MADARPPALVELHQDEVLTGEAVALDVQPVGFFPRALGTFIDMVLGILLLVAFVFVAIWLSGEGILADAVIPILAIVMLVLVTVVIPTTVETATRGRSLGKLAVGARIVRADGGASGFRQAFIRALVGVLELWFTLGSLAGVVGAFTPRAQRLGDLLAGTYSERTRTPPLPPTVAGVPPVLVGWAEIADVARLPDSLARRVSQFLRQAAGMQPAARERIARALADDVRGYVSPLPAVDPETLLWGVHAVRRDRELRAIELENRRTAALTAGVTAGPRGFPER